MYINAQAGKSGSFQAAATSTDGDSGILKLNFPTLSGFTSGGGDTSSSPYQTTYNWTGAVGASGSQTITSHNNATLTNTNTFTVTPDTTNPTGGALTVNGTTATGPGSTSYNSSGSFTISAITDYTRRRLRAQLLAADTAVGDTLLLGRDRGRQLRQLRQLDDDQQPRHPDQRNADRPQLLPVHAHRHRQGRQHHQHHHHRQGRHEWAVGAVGDVVVGDG